MDDIDSRIDMYHHEGPVSIKHHADAMIGQSPDAAALCTACAAPGSLTMFTSAPL